jgi:hypothetical protein
MPDTSPADRQGYYWTARDWQLFHAHVGDILWRIKDSRGSLLDPKQVLSNLQHIAEGRKLAPVPPPPGATIPIALELWLHLSTQSLAELLPNPRFPSRLMRAHGIYNLADTLLWSATEYLDIEQIGEHTIGLLEATLSHYGLRLPALSELEVARQAGYWVPLTKDGSIRVMTQGVEGVALTALLARAPATARDLRRFLLTENLLTLRDLYQYLDSQGHLLRTADAEGIRKLHQWAKLDRFGFQLPAALSDAE